MMEKEFTDWRSQYRQLSEQLEREQKYVDVSIKNLKKITTTHLKKIFVLEKRKK